VCFSRCWGARVAAKVTWTSMAGAGVGRPIPRLDTRRCVSDGAGSASSGAVCVLQRLLRGAIGAESFVVAPEGPSSAAVVAAVGSADPRRLPRGEDSAAVGTAAAGAVAEGCCASGRPAAESAASGSAPGAAASAAGSACGAAASPLLAAEGSAAAGALSARCC
jgi:hypothetical protein